MVGHELFPLPANACHDGKVDLRYSYETATHRVAIEAFSGGSGANKSVAIDVALPRILLEPGTAPSPELFEFAKLFITPNDPVIKQKVKELFQGDQYAFLCPHGPPDPKCPDWMVLDAIEAWVEYYVKSTGLVSVYAGSRLLAGDEIVQVPRETLQSEKGNDFDKALLVVSLARAAGIRSDKIFVVVGTNGTTGTGWVYDKVDRRVPHLTNWHQPPWCQCSDYGYVFHPACCPKSEGCRSDVCGLLYTWAVYYFNDEVAEMAT
ncbi:MAG: hypothetical protein LAN71_17335 [Acidobacteriia bacterium]|nr:hypothetical protein [Terriglobia bacterium]